MKSKVLLVGGAGYIGGLTTDSLLKKGFDVTVYDNLLYEERYMKNINFVFGDIRDTQKVVDLSNDYDTIILMAALVGDPACSVDTQLTEDINFTAIKNICLSLPKNKHVIFMSTCSVYGAQDGILDENSQTNPLSSYATTKLLSEKYVLERNGTVFRLGTVFGLGDTYSRLRMDLVVNVLTMKAIKYGEISINGGDQWRPIISVIDIAEYVSEACETKPSGVFILSKENVIIRELGEKIASIIPNVKIKYNEISFQDARNYKVDNTKSLTIFKYKPVVTVEDEVKKMMSVFTDKRVKNPEDSIYHNGQFIKELKNRNNG
jgi:nucleoside-diphosphate-sugar epimerase